MSVRSGIWTHALIRGPEFPCLLPMQEARLHLESGALDHSAILTVDMKVAKFHDLKKNC